jgi:DNA polymerase-3 subunit alpha
LNITTYYSILQCILSPEKIIKACKAAGYKSLILSDTNLSGAVEFYETCKKEGIKPIIGVTLKVTELPVEDKGDHNRMHDLTLVARNKAGYKNLLKIVSLSNEFSHILDTKYQRIPRLHLDEIKPYTEGLTALIGAEGTELYAYANETTDLTSVEYVLKKYQNLFEEVLFNGQIEENSICWSNTRYLKDEEQEDFHVILSILLKCRLKELPKKIAEELPSALPLLGSLRLLTKEERNSIFTAEQVAATDAFLDSIEEYDILSKPNVPKYNCPDGMSQSEYLTNLCRVGWRTRFPSWSSEEKKKVYADRIKYELEVLQSCELDGYFLVVQDYINWAKRSGMLVGPGRGSSAGSLVAYVLGITEIDPIPYNLLFERFYSADRSAGGIISLPDIDTDFPKYRREEVVEYIENKYGKNRVGHIITFGTLKGAGALTEVLRSHDIFEPKKIKSLTKGIPAQDKISDKLEEQKEDSIIRFTLKNFPKVLQELGLWESYNTKEEEKGRITGEYSYYLEQAIRIEGCIRGYGIHASGILLSDESLDEFAPLIIESNGENRLVAYEMVAAEKSGIVKIDALGLECLDKLQEVQRLLLGISEDQ